MLKNSSSIMIYADQSSRDLRLNIIEGELDLRQFNLLMSDTVSNPRIMIKASIIGASHLIQYRINDSLINEAFACIDVGSDKTRAYSMPLKNIAESVSLNFTDDIIYEFDTRQVDWAVGREEAEELERMAMNAGDMEVGLVYDFPRESQPFKPKTIVYVKLSEDETAARVKTLHSYPSEDTLVFTNTVITL